LTNWPAIDAWRQAQAWKSHARFPQSQTNDYGDSIGDSKRYLTRSAGEQRDGKMVEPGALETCNTEKPFEAVLLARTRAQRIPSRSRAHAQIKTGYICADHTVIFTFRLRQSGGPYIPYCRQSRTWLPEPCARRIRSRTHLIYPKSGRTGWSTTISRPFVKALTE
jgi:hypothetical protein